MSPDEPAKCLLCGAPLVGSGRTDQGFRIYFDCPRCGLFGLTRPAALTLDTLLTDARKKAVLSYGIRHTPRRGPDTTVFDPEACKKIVDAGVLLTPQEQADNLIRWLGTNLPGPGERIRSNFIISGARLECSRPTPTSLCLGRLDEDRPSAG